MRCAFGQMRSLTKRALLCYLGFIFTTAYNLNAAVLSCLLRNVEAFCHTLRRRLHSPAINKLRHLPISVINLPCMVRAADVLHLPLQAFTAR